MHKIALHQWSTLEAPQQDQYELWAIPDNETIHRVAATPTDLALSLKVAAGNLYDYGYAVIATERDQNNEAWLALCKIN